MAHNGGHVVVVDERLSNVYYEALNKRKTKARDGINTNKIIKYMHNLFDAIKHCMFFIPNHTTLPRWLEISYGILFWVCLVVIIYIIM